MLKNHFGCKYCVRSDSYIIGEILWYVSGEEGPRVSLGQGGAPPVYQQTVQPILTTLPTMTTPPIMTTTTIPLQLNLTLTTTDPPHAVSYTFCYYKCMLSQP